MSEQAQLSTDDLVFDLSREVIDQHRQNDWDYNDLDLHIRLAITAAIKDRETLRAQLAAAEEERADLNATFDLRHAADARAIERWRQNHPERALILPDHADLCVWLLEQMTATEKDRDVWHLAHDLIINTDVEAQRAKALEEKLAAAEQRIESLEQDKAAANLHWAEWQAAAKAAEQRAETAERRYTEADQQVSRLYREQDALRALVGELCAALRAVEWADRETGGNCGACPICQKLEGWPHEPDCILAAALAKGQEVSG